MISFVSLDHTYYHSLLANLSIFVRVGAVSIHDRITDVVDELSEVFFLWEIVFLYYYFGLCT